MELLTKEEFNKKIGQRMRELREQMGLSQVEVAERVSQVPVDAEMRMRRLAAVSALVTWLREERELSCEQLAKRSEVPASFVRDLEGLRDFNPGLLFSVSSEPRLRPYIVGIYAESGTSCLDKAGRA